VINTRVFMQVNNQVESILQRYPANQKDNVIPVFQDLQDSSGYLSQDAMIRMSNYFSIPVSKLYSIASFYNQFRFEPRGMFHIRICRGTACHILGSLTVLQVVEKLLKIRSGETTKDGRFSLEVVDCMGACSMSPIIAVNERFYEKIDSEKIKEIIQLYRQ
jgi:NADH-quinone oxidoreductase E subunit